MVDIIPDTCLIVSRIQIHEVIVKLVSPWVKDLPVC